MIYIRVNLRNEIVVFYIVSSNICMIGWVVCFNCLSNLIFFIIKEFYLSISSFFFSIIIVDL